MNRFRAAVSAAAVASGLLVGAVGGALTAPAAHADDADPCLWIQGNYPPPPAVCPVLHSPGFPFPIFNIFTFPQPQPPAEGN